MIDNVLVDKNISPNVFSLVKIDVEGYEYFALKGMQSVLKARQARFIVENNPPAQKALGVSMQNILNDFFYPYGYTIFWIGSKSNRSFFYKKRVHIIPITSGNVHLFENKSGDFLAVPSDSL